MPLVIRWLLSTIAIFATGWLLPGVTVTAGGAALTAVALGLVNAIIKPILLLLTLPITILTLGLFAVVLNALLVLLISAVVPGFEVDGFWWAVAFGLVVGVVTWILYRLAPGD